VKRYTLSGDRMFPDELGGWVTFEDADRLRAERDRYAHANREQALELGNLRGRLTRAEGFIVESHLLLEELRAERDALRAAAGKVKCKRCKGTKWAWIADEHGMNHPVDCPDCADLRALLAPSPPPDRAP
jgi:hypothetical protein